MSIFMFGTGAMAAILEKWQFLAYATNFQIPPNAFLKVWVFCLYARTRINTAI